MRGSQRRWVVRVVALAVAVILAVVVTRKAGDVQNADCVKVHVLESYNRWFLDGRASGSDKSEPNSIDEYREWAAELHRYAGEIKDAGLKAKAEAVSGLADQYVESVAKLRPDLPSVTDTRPPSSPVWHEASRAGHQLNDAVVALTVRC